MNEKKKLIIGIVIVAIIIILSIVIVSNVSKNKEKDLINNDIENSNSADNLPEDGGADVEPPKDSVHVKEEISN